MVQTQAAEMPLLWVGMLKRVDFNDPDILKGPRGRMFHDMLVAFPKAAGIDADEVLRSMADADDLDKMTVAFHLQKILDGEDVDDGLCNDDFLDNIKLLAFKRFNAARFAAMDDAERFRIFMMFLDAKPTDKIKEARDHFYAMTPVPQALKDYHRATWTQLDQAVLSVDDPKSLAGILRGVRQFHMLDNKGKADLAHAISCLIAKAYCIPEPYIYEAEYEKEGIAACGLQQKDHVRSFVQYKYKDFKTAFAFIEATFHEVAGHAVENVLVRRANADVWNSFNPGVQKHYARIDTDTPLGKGALLLAFNCEESHRYAYYCPLEKNFNIYRSQLNERVAAWVAEEGGKRFYLNLKQLIDAAEGYLCSCDNSQFSAEALGRLVTEMGLRRVDLQHCRLICQPQ
jgi:hypothetical protein